MFFVDDKTKLYSVPVLFAKKKKKKKTRQDTFACVPARSQCQNTKIKKGWKLILEYLYTCL